MISWLQSSVLSENVHYRLERVFVSFLLLPTTYNYYVLPTTRIRLQITNHGSKWRFCDSHVDMLPYGKRGMMDRHRTIDRIILGFFCIQIYIEASYEQESPALYSS